MCITDVYEPNDAGEIAEAVASEAETIFAEESVLAAKLDIPDDSMGIDVYIVCMCGRSLCGLYIEVAMWSRRDLFGHICICPACMSGMTGPTRSTLIPRRRDMTLPQYRFCFTSGTTPEGRITRCVDEDATQSAPQIGTVNGLEVDDNTLLHGLMGLQ